MANGSPPWAKQRAVPAGGGRLADGELLEAFVQTQDQAAFEALVRRHGPLVLGVCRRILGDGHDAEDAFQATFLVLVRKAQTIVPRDLVANWLYGVAYRTASKAQAMKVKRRVKEAQVRERPVADAHQEILWRDLLPVLDRELQALPDKYRAAIVLCDLEGRPRKEAAAQLGWPEGTLSSRLAAGRKLLARRLERSGLTLSNILVPLLAMQAALSPVPPALFDATLRAGLLVAAGHAAGAAASVAAVALADGVIKSMLLAKLKATTAVMLVLLLAGTGWLAESRWHCDSRIQQSLSTADLDQDSTAAANRASMPVTTATQPARVVSTMRADEYVAGARTSARIGQVLSVQWDRVSHTHVRILPLRLLLAGGTSSGAGSRATLVHNGQIRRWQFRVGCCLRESSDNDRNAPAAGQPLIRVDVRAPLPPQILPGRDMHPMG